MNSGRGENPREISDPDNMTGESLDQEMILNDEDSSGVKATEKIIHEDGEENYHDPKGFIGPVHSHIEADNLSDEFLNGDVDLVQQMQKSVDAIHDAYEGELRDRPSGP